jgi:hypothetical protein
MEALHILEWCHSKVDKVSHIEGNRSSLGIGITLLPRLGCFEVVADKMDLFFSFLDDVGAKDLTLSHFRPVERGTTLASIKGFEGGHLQTSLVAIVVAKFSERQAVFPLGSIR